MVTTVAALLLLPRGRWPGGARETLASLSYVENWYLAGASHEYGAADPTQSPWQHLWSLSVQGQFFLFVPLALAAVHLATRRLSPQGRGAALLTLLLGLVVSSFAVASYLSAVDPSVAYFHTYARLWEFLLGTVIALLPLGRWRSESVWSAILGWLGLAAIVATGFLVDGAASFPGPAALLPVGGAAAVIVCRHRFGPGMMLGLRPLEVAGRYAYGLYLWHWPVLVFAVVAGFGHDRVVASSLVLLVSLGLAVSSYHLIEVPMRRGPDAEPRRLRRLVRGLSWALSLALLASSAGWLLKLDRDRAALLVADRTSQLATHPGALSVVDQAFADYPTDVPPIPALTLLPVDWPSVVEDGCITPADSDGSRVVRCSYGQTDSPVVIALVGASHAESWFSVMTSLAERRGWRLDVYLRPGCVLTLPDPEATDPCQRWLNRLLDRLAAEPPDVVVTNSTRQQGSIDAVPSGFRAAFARIVEHSALVGLRDNPRFDPSMPECAQGPGPCEVPLGTRLAPVDPALELNLPRARFLDLNDLICPDGVCRPVVGNRYVFRDVDHVSDTYAQTMARPGGDRIGAAIDALIGAG